MAKNRVDEISDKQERKKQITSSEIIGIFLIFLAIFIFISLISYDSRDPSWTNTGWAKTAPSNYKIHNFTGRVGAFISDAFLQVLGLASFFLPLGLIYLGIQLFTSEGKRRFYLRTGGILFLLLAFSSFLSLIFGSLYWRGAEIRSGGLAGKLITSFMIRYFNHLGTYLVLIVLLLVFTILRGKDIFLSHNEMLFTFDLDFCT